jgi:hypothetical protein
VTLGPRSFVAIAVSITIIPLTMFADIAPDPRRFAVAFLELWRVGRPDH